MSLICKSIFLVSLGFLLCFTAQAQDKAELKGKMMAERYCGACHAYPSPSLLPKATALVCILAGRQVSANHQYFGLCGHRPRRTNL